MAFIETTATRKIKNMSHRIRALPGGSSASKTVSVMLYLIALAQSDKQPTLTSIVSESFPHLRRGVIKDFLDIMIQHKYFKDSRWKGGNEYTFETGSRIEFFSADSPDKMRGGRRDRLFINEANNVSFDAFEQLEIRTKSFVFIDWNPSSEFWYYTDVKGKRDDVEEIVLTWRDNEGCPQAIIDSIEARKNRVGWYKCYGLGQLGEVEGRIYTGWQIIDELPHEAKLVSRGLDFGFTNDCSVLVSVYKFNGGYILEEEFYQTGMRNSQISDFIKNLDNSNVLVVADSAEPKSISEISLAGVNIIGVKKGKDSVSEGIDFIQDQRISVTKKSVNLIKSYRNYLWKVDKDGKIMNVPDHNWSDGADAVRYGMSVFREGPDTKSYDIAVSDFLANTNNEGRLPGFKYEDDPVLEAMEGF